MSTNQTEPDVPMTVVAVRVEGGSGWRLRALCCEPEDIPQQLEGDPSAQRHRVIARKTSQGLYPGRVEELAAGAGWTKHGEGELWFPLEEPLPELPGLAVSSDVSLKLSHVLHGHIAVAVTAGGKRLELIWNKLHDALELLVRFVQVLTASGEPHAYLVDSMCSLVVVQNGAAPDLCRFYVRADGRVRAMDQDSVDVVTDRNGLLRQFRALCLSLAAKTVSCLAEVVDGGEQVSPQGGGATTCLGPHPCPGSGPVRFPAHGPRPPIP